MTRRQHVSHGRSKAERGLDQFDTPAQALAPLFVHEPLLVGVMRICEVVCGRWRSSAGDAGARHRGLRQRHRGSRLPGFPVLDFLKMSKQTGRL